MAFGSDSAELWPLLQRIPGWDCVHCTAEMAAVLGPRLERELATPVRYLGDVYFTLQGPAHPQEHSAVRRLTEVDLALLEESPSELHPVGFGSLLAALSGGIVAGAIIDGTLVGTVAMSVSSEEHADMGAAVLEPWRNRGIGSAAASLVATEMRGRGWTPVWSTGETNLASQRVARKVGFREFGRMTYILVPSLRASGGFRPSG